MIEITKEEIKALDDAFSALYMHRSSYDQVNGTDAEVLDAGSRVMSKLKDQIGVG